MHVLVALGEQRVPIFVELVQGGQPETLIAYGVDAVGDQSVVVGRVFRSRGAWSVIDVAGVVDAGVGALADEGSRNIVDVAAARIVVDHRSNRKGIRDQRQVDHRLDIGAGIAVARVLVCGADVALRYVEVGLIRDIAQHAGFRAGSEQGALRTFEHFDTLEIRRIDVQIAARQGTGLIIEINCDIGKTADAAGSLRAGQGRRQSAHVDRTLTRAAAGRGYVR